MKRMLINATQQEELRVAIANGQHLLDLDIEVPSADQKKGNIYKARITRVEPSLEACFVDFGSDRHGFLPMKEINPSCYKESASKSSGRVSIRDAVTEGQEIIIQVTKEERGNKGAALTTNISLAGRYMVLMPTNSRAGGVSRRIEGEDRQHIRDLLKQMEIPSSMGLIVRTACVGRDLEELQWDLDYLLHLWSAIETAAAKRKAPFLIYQESNLIIRALRDYLRNDIGEILVDSEATFNEAREFMQQVMPHNLRKLKLYEDRVPLFNRYQIETQIESAFAREVHLPSGGSIVIDNTEALVAIDINSARSTKGTDIEETAYHTNLEAAEEIARQYRLRDLGGLVVIDFIDMNSRRHQKEVEDRLRDAVKMDKARIQIGKISRFGLLEMSRQRLRPSLGESSKETCPRCDGQGRIRSIESLSLSLLRLMEEESMKDLSGQIIAEVPTEVANFLLNEKRASIRVLEERSKIDILVLANSQLEHPKFEIRRIRKGSESADPSYSQTSEEKVDVIATQLSQASVSIDKPAVARISPPQPAPHRQSDTKKGPGLLSRVFSFLGGSNEEETKPETKKKVSKKRGRRPAQRGNTQARKGQGGNRNQRSRHGNKQAASDESQQKNQQQKKKVGKKKTGKKKTSRRRPNPRQNQNQSQNQNKNPDQGQEQAKKQAAGNDSAKGPATPAKETNKAQHGGTQDSGKDQNSKTEKPDTKPEAPRKQPRRRRSPYKTAGRDNRKTNPKDSSQQPTESGQTTATNKPAEDKQATAAAKPVESQKKTETAKQPVASKPAGENKKPAVSKSAEAGKPVDTKAPAKAKDSNKIDVATEAKAQVKTTVKAEPKKPAASKAPTDAKKKTESKTPAKPSEASTSKQKDSRAKSSTGLDNAPPAASEPPPGLYKLKSSSDGKIQVEPLKKNALQASIEASRKKPE